ncbi:MAG TPA: MarR family transcriptional regulator [Acidimicrobiales bacterium]|jgi:DNA-binding MarR family transcriptional regulator|nr:MarR family transcriptional regulator [Acidimicrobiales bacterium]
MSRADLKRAEELYVAIRHVSRALRINDLELGLSPIRSDVLAVLAFHPPMSVGDLARHEGVASPSMTRLLVDMERDGLVRRYADPDDGRRLLAAATAEGRLLIQSARERNIGLFAAELRRAKLGPDQLSALVAVLECVAG